MLPNLEVVAESDKARPRESATRAPERAPFTSGGVLLLRSPKSVATVPHVRLAPEPQFRSDTVRRRVPSAT